MLIVFYVIVLVPDFFSTQDPEATEAPLAFIPVQGISFIDSSGFNLSVPAVVGKRNPVTLRMEWKIDETKKVPIAFFHSGVQVQSAGTIRDQHSLDRYRPIPSQPTVSICSARIGWDAISGRG